MAIVFSCYGGDLKKQLAYLFVISKNHMKELSYLTLSKGEVCSLINKLCPAQLQEVAGVVWALSNPKEALSTYAERLDFPDGCQGKFRKALANIFTDIANYSETLQWFGYRLLVNCGIGLRTEEDDSYGYDGQEMRHISVALIGQSGTIEETAFDRLGGPFELDIPEYLDMSKKEKLRWMELWRNWINEKLHELVEAAQLELKKTSGDK